MKRVKLHWQQFISQLLSHLMCAWMQWLLLEANTQRVSERERAVANTQNNNIAKQQQTPHLQWRTKQSCRKMIYGFAFDRWWQRDQFTVCTVALCIVWTQNTKKKLNFEWILCMCYGRADFSVALLLRIIIAYCPAIQSTDNNGSRGATPFGRAKKTVICIVKYDEKNKFIACNV